MQLTFVTGNDAKFGEAREVFPDLVRAKIDLPEIQSADQSEIVRAKLTAAVTQGLNRVMVEDTSLELSCFGGLPGPFIKFFIARLGSARISEIAHTLGDVRARAVALVACSIDGRIIEARGEVSGSLVPPRGTWGFGFDPIFVPDGCSETFAEMSPESRADVRHRFKAMRNLREALSNVRDGQS